MSAPPQQTIQQQNEEIIKELRAIRQLLERLTQPQPLGAAAADDREGHQPEGLRARQGRTRR